MAGGAGFSRIPEDPAVRITSARREPEKAVTGAVKVAAKGEPAAATAEGTKTDGKGDAKAPDGAGEAKK